MAAVPRCTLPDQLIALSTTRSWPEVLSEWQLDYVEVLDNGKELKTCLCQHYPISEVCHIVNTQTGNTAIVGNCCVEKFGNDQGVFSRCHKIFDAYKRIVKDKTASANKELIDYAFSKGAINKIGYYFYKKIWDKSTLPQADLLLKMQLNQSIINYITGQTQEAEATKVITPRLLQDLTNQLKQSPRSVADSRLVKYAFLNNKINAIDYIFYQILLNKRIRFRTREQQRWQNAINQRMLG